MTRFAFLIFEVFLFFLYLDDLVVGDSLIPQFLQLFFLSSRL